MYDDIWIISEREREREGERVEREREKESHLPNGPGA